MVKRNVFTINLNLNVTKQQLKSELFRLREQRDDVAKLVSAGSRSHEFVHLTDAANRWEEQTSQCYVKVPS
jgi:predicted  nucleic acid-binding Zn-ribbon protein